MQNNYDKGALQGIGPNRIILQNPHIWRGIWSTAWENYVTSAFQAKYHTSLQNSSSKQNLTLPYMIRVRTKYHHSSGHMLHVGPTLPVAATRHSTAWILVPPITASLQSQACCPADDIVHRTYFLSHAMTSISTQYILGTFQYATFVTSVQYMLLRISTYHANKCVEF
jgi:hypothetical protein